MGGFTKYYMTGPSGDVSRGYWEWLAIDEGRSFEVLDGFAWEDGQPNPEMPSMRMTMEFAETALGSRQTTTTHFNTLDELEQLQAIGMVEGMSSAMAQIDDVLADLTTFAVDRATQAQLIGATQARVSRVVRGTVPQLWEAFTNEALLRRWQLGPDGWTMIACEAGATPGDTVRAEWRNDATSESFGFVGVVAEAVPMQRLVSTERWFSPEDPDGAASPESLNELTFTPVVGGTLASYLITYASAEARDQMLATGMADGMEASFARLEREILV